MTWHCDSCGTTLTWAEPITSNPGMQKCPRCDKWMSQPAGSGTTAEAGAA